MTLAIAGKILYTRGPVTQVRQKYLKEYGLANRGRKHNKRVSKCISGKVRGEGWDERQAVAACLNMDRPQASARRWNLSICQRPPCTTRPWYLAVPLIAMSKMPIWTSL